MRWLWGVCSVPRLGVSITSLSAAPGFAWPRRPGVQPGHRMSLHSSLVVAAGEEELRPTSCLPIRKAQRQ
jgi:hypothetical protein